MDSASELTSYAGPRTPPLRVYRVAAGLKQRDLAELAGVRQETVCRIETGRVAPSRRSQKALAVALGVPVGELFPEASA